MGSHPVGCGVSGIPELTAASRGLRIQSITPNPVGLIARVTYVIPRNLLDSHFTLTVYDASGRLVKRLLDGNRVPGTYNVLWDGRNDEGRSVSSGVYFLHLETSRISRTQRVVLVR